MYQFIAPHTYLYIYSIYIITYIYPKIINMTHGPDGWIGYNQISDGTLNLADGN